MDLAITDHALERMLERGVTEANIRSALSGPHENLPEAVPSRRKIRATLPEGALIVVYAPEGRKKVIVSAWWEGR